MKKKWPSLYFAIFLIPLIYNPWGAANPYEITKQVWMMGIIAAALFCIAILVLMRRQIALPANHIVLAIAGLWILSFTLSTIFSDAPVESFWGTYIRMQGFLSHMYYGIHFLLCLYLFEHKDFQKYFFHTVLAVGVIVAIYAWLQFLGVDVLRGPSEPTVFGNRVFAMLGTPTMLGQFLLFPFFIAAGLVFHAKSKLHARPYFAMAVLFLSVIVLAQNRASILGIGVAVIVMAAYRYAHTKKQLVFIAAGLLLTGVLFLYFGPEVRSLNSRYVLWANSLQLFLDAPLLGSGPETFYQTFQKVLPKELFLFERMGDLPDRAHNVFVDTLLMRGLFGFGLVIINVIFLAYLFLKKKLKSANIQIVYALIVAYGISVFFSFSLAVHAIYLTAFWALLLREVFVWKEVKIRLWDSAKLVIAIVLMAGSLFSVSHAYPIVQADISFAKFIPAYFENYKAGLKEFKRIFNSAPQYAYFDTSFFIFYTDWAASDAEVREELKRASGRLGHITNRGYQYYFSQAQLLEALGEYKSAKKMFLEAIQRAPNFPELWLAWGRAAYDRRDFAEAEWALQRYVDLAPPYWQWEDSLESITPEQREIFRVFKISNPQFFEALTLLRTATFHKQKQT
ncbi:hypothetical protein COV82_04580 [Candidatus Peregrinibacteria bacterium CG11_big_fil_rev_8_21_14_0_20_46_8]|nr:MAG: hypothetical protein COV82_04580 [Candidatus Peregrinibacteria bacterium CG11_big_fil_rev_8_21_14_0_20_46_8]